MADLSELTGHRRLAGARVVMMCGISGSGKTTVARMFEARGFVRMSLDGRIWERYGNGFASLPEAERKAVFMTEGQALCEAVCRLAGEGRRVVVDATMCKRAVRDRLRDGCREAGVEPVTVYMEAPKAVLAKRLTARHGLGPDDQIVSPGELDSFYEGFEVPGVDEDAIVVRQ